MKPLQSELDAAAKHRASVEGALSGLGVLRFFQTGSFQHGTGVHPYSDVDYLVSLSGGRPDSSDTALGRVRQALKQRFPNTKVKVRRPAVVIEFAGGKEPYEIVPGYYKRSKDGDAVYDIPGASSGWIESSPEAHLKYVNESNSKANKRAKPLARVVKAWKYHRFVPVSSFYLEMRAAKHARENVPVIYSMDILSLFRSLKTLELLAMNDPSSAVGRIYACSSAANKQDALSKLDTAISRAQKARDAENDDRIKDAFDWWDQVFYGHFPSYA